MNELWSWFERGGVLMWPLLGCSVVACAIIIEKLLVLRLPIQAPPDLLSLVRPYLASGRTEELLQECLRRPSPLSRLVATLLQERHVSRDDLRDILYEKGREELPALQRRLNLLGTIATVAPLLGLLGTVLGMIRVFGVISVEGLSSESLSAGISEALLTTAGGLAVAIPSLVAYQIFSHRALFIAQSLEQEGFFVIRLLKPYSQDSSGSFPSAAALPASAASGVSGTRGGSDLSGSTSGQR